MICWAAGKVRCALGAVLLLLLLICGAEVALRLAELRAPRRIVPGRVQTPLESITVPSWTTHRELRPLASIHVRAPAADESHEIRINSFGLRGPEIDVPKPADVYRVVCLGDELVFGAHLAEDDQLCARLQQRLQRETKYRIEVWNCGVPGGCPLTEYLQMTHRLALLQPDLVLAAVHEGDLADDLTYRRYCRTDRQGVPLACRHPSLGRKPRNNQLTAWREEFRLVDLGLRWAGSTWKRKSEFDNSLDEDGAPIDLASLRSDRPAIDRLLQPFVPLADWCRKSHAGFCAFEVRSAAPQSPLTTALEELSAREKFLFVELNREPAVLETGRGRNWSAQEHRDFAEELGGRIVATVAGPWASPYYRPENGPITPASHHTNQRPARIMQRDAALPR